jgi:hypothetical protein
MSQPPDNNFEHGLVHDEGEAEDYTPEVPQDANGDPMWDPNVQQQYPDQGVQQWEQNAPLAGAEEAAKLAGAALHICQNPRNNYAKDGKIYLRVEAWTGIARLASTIPGIEIVKDNILGGVPGLTARATLKNTSGKLLSQAEGFVGQDETFWKTMSDRNNVVQTRAVGRVCRLVFSFVVQEMNTKYGTNFEMTPYEEMAAMEALQRQAQPQPPQPPALGQRTQFIPPPPQPSYPGSYASLGPSVQPNTVYLNPAAYPSPQPNVQPSIGQQGAVWQGQLMNVEIKMVQGKNGPSELFIIHLTDRRNASTFDKTIAGSAGFMIGKNVEMQVVPRGQGRFNVSTIRAL